MSNSLVNDKLPAILSNVEDSFRLSLKKYIATISNNVDVVSNSINENRFDQRS